MSQYNHVMPHGRLEEVFPDIFFVMGTMKGEFFGAPWQFGRNMIVVREDGDLSLINAVRLDEAGLKELEALGTVRNVVKIGSMHGHDDRFYLDRYDATMWALPGMPHEEGIEVHKELGTDGLPFSGAELFTFQETRLPEAILLLDRDGGIAIACDSLQNWEGPDPFTNDETVERMTSMGFYTRANCGPAWMHVNEPKPGDFARLKQKSFKHVLAGHGTPLKDEALPAFHATFERLYGV